MPSPRTSERSTSLPRGLCRTNTNWSSSTWIIAQSYTDQSHSYSHALYHAELGSDNAPKLKCPMPVLATQSLVSTIKSPLSPFLPITHSRSDQKSLPPLCVSGVTVRRFYNPAFLQKTVISANTAKSQVSFWTKGFWSTSLCAEVVYFQKLVLTAASG